MSGTVLVWKWPMMFDTEDQRILASHPGDCGVTGPASECLRSYLSVRSYFPLSLSFSSLSHLWKLSKFYSWVLFFIYTPSLGFIFKKYILFHSDAHHTQIYLQFKLNRSFSLKAFVDYLENNKGIFWYFLKIYLLLNSYKLLVLCHFWTGSLKTKYKEAKMTLKVSLKTSNNDLMFFLYANKKLLLTNIMLVW